MTSLRPPAPAPLDLVQRFVNTHDVETGREDLSDPAALAAWLTGEGLLGAAGPAGHVDAAALGRAVTLREAIRTVLDRHCGPEAASAARERVNAVAATAAIRPVLTADGGSALEPGASGLDGALGRIVASIHRAAADGTWERLRVCANERCLWAFYDTSKNRSGRWCAMGVCGSREKSRRAYRRKRAKAAAGEAPTTPGDAGGTPGDGTAPY